MTRKDFEIIALIVAKVKRGETRAEIDAVLKETNQNYNSERFWARVEHEETAW